MGTATYESLYQNTIIDELRRLNGITIGGITISIDVDSIIKSIPKKPCACMKCYLLQF